MERTYPVRNLRVAVSLLCLAACALLVVVWCLSYSYFDVIRGPLLRSRGFQITSCDGRLHFTEVRLSSAVGWQWSRVTLQEVDNEPVMRQLKRRYEILQKSLAKQLAERPAGKSSNELEARLENTNVDFESIREELKQGLLRSWPVAPNTLPVTNFSAGATPKSHFGFSFQSMANGTGFVVPFWFLVLVSGVCAVIGWLRWRLRFSLRTMLIATTLVAITLGIIAVVKR